VRGKNRCNRSREDLPCELRKSRDLFDQLNRSIWQITEAQLAYGKKK
jgi:hypothetical protein